MKLEFDSTEKPETLRAVAAFALMLAGDIDIPSVRDTDQFVRDGQGNPVVVPHGAGAGASREMILPPNELPRSIIGKGNDPYPNGYASASLNVVPFPTAPSAPVAPSTNSPGAVQPTVIPVPPPFPSSAATATPSPQVASAMAAAGVQPAASASPSGPVEYDTAGLPWDARIHNKGRTKKKDGTWKLQKGLDPIIAQTVVAELAARKLVPGAVAAPPTFPMPAQSAPVPQPQSAQMHAMQPQVSRTPQGGTMGYSQPLGQGPLTPDPTAEARAAFSNRPIGMLPELGAPYAPAAPPMPAPNGQPYPLGLPGPNTVPLPPYGTYPAPLNTGSLPMPPFPGSAAPAMVPPQPIAAPVPSAPQPGTIGGGNAPVSGYKALIDKLTAATQNKTLNPAFVAPTVQRFGVPNMGLLGNPEYAVLLPAISQEFDRLIAGGAPSGP